MENKQYAIGIDVGGTNTDAVIMEYPGRKIISYAKTGTTEDFNTGIMNSIQKVLVSQSAITENHISSLMIGTTTFLNAIIQRSSELNKVEVIRLCGPTSIAYPPFMTFPKQLAKSIQSSTHFIGGGYEYDKQLITPLDTKKLAEIAQELFSKYKNSKEILSIAVMGIFSPLYHEQEIEAKKILQTVFKENNFSNYRISLSHKIAGLGLLEREGATLLNASLIALARKTIYVLQESLAKLRLVNCKNNIFLTQNDGTLISCEKASKYPIFTSNSGPNNSLRGAAALTNTRNGFVVDIGGTSTDVAVLKNGFARPASSYVKIGGVRTNFFLADTISIALGGGSLVRFSEDGKKCVIGPSSVGYKLPHSAQVFGGTILTTTDIAVASGILTLDGADPSLVKATKEQLALARAEMISMLSNAVDKMKSTSEEVPIILVGGGSALFPTNMKIQGISEIIRPEHFSVANAVGAGIAQVSSTAESCMDLGVSGAMDAQEKLKEKAIELAVNKGAIRDTIELFVEKLHIAYISANHFRVTYRAVGDIDTRNFSLGMTGLDEPSSIADVVIESSVIKPFTEEIKDLEDHKEFTFAEPIVVEENGEKVWILSEEDVECIGLGAAILGAGGGGSPYASVLELTSLVREGMKIKVISIDSLKEDEYVIYVAYYGAPLMMLERLGGSKKIAIALETMRSFFPDKKVVAVSAIEIGGLNSLAPLYVSGVTGLPTVDIDFMGRAFPQFQMTTLSIYDKSLGPCCMSDEKGNQILVCSVQDNLPVNFETQLRKIAMNLGLECGLAGPPISSNDVKAVGVRDTVSRVWRLGRTLLQARAAKLHPLRILEEVENAKLIFEGKIVDVMRATVDGYNKGTMIIQGLGEYEQRNLMIEFQNENLIAREYDSSTKCDDKGIPLESKVLAVVPDLITLCDSEDFQPVLTEDLRYGLRISVITLPANPILISERALGVVGPKCFGYNDVEFLPSAEYVSPKSVFKQ